MESKEHELNLGQIKVDMPMRHLMSEKRTSRKIDLAFDSIEVRVKIM